MKVKEMIGEVLAQLVAEDDPIKRTEIIDNAESLGTEIPEANEGGEDFETMYTDLKQKFLTRFGEELSTTKETKEAVDPDAEPDPEPDEPDADEDDTPKKRTYEEAGITT